MAAPLSHPTYNRQTGLKRGQGWVERTRAGRFQARPGKHLRPLGTFDTREEAIAALTSAVTPPDEITLTDYLAGFVRLRSTRWSQRTRDNYIWYAERKICPVVGHLQLHEIDQHVINEWWIGLAANTGAIRNGEQSSGHSTCAKVWRFLRMVLKQADRDGLVLHPIDEPVAGAGREQAPERVLLSKAQVHSLLQHLPAERRIVAILSATCGLRWSEVLGLQRQSIDRQGEVIWVQQVVSERTNAVKLTKEPKSVAGRRAVPVHPTVIAIIDDHLARYVQDTTPAARLVVTRNGTPVSRSTWGTQWRRARRLSGLDGLRPAIGVHDLRHHALTHASAATGQLRDVMALAGHSTSSAALRYQHRANTDLRHLAQPFYDNALTDGVPSNDPAHELEETT